MSTNTLDMIIETVKEIPEEKHAELLDVIKKFKCNADKLPPVSGKWDEFFGIISDETADKMVKTIEEEFEVIENE